MKKTYQSFLTLLGLIIIFSAGTAQAQLKIGTNGANIAPASLLELESANQGLLIPRMANTVAIDALNPPEGMLIYITTAPSGLYVRKATAWEYLTGFLSGNAFFNSVTVTGAVTAGSFSGPLTGNATTATTALNSTNSANSAVTNDISNPAITYPVFVNSTPGNQPLRTSSGNLSYVPATGILTARGFTGPLTGDVTGNATSAVDAQNTVNLRVTDDLVTPTTMYPTFVAGTAGPLPARVSSTRLSFIPLTGELTAPIFRGNLLGNATSATTVTGVVNAPNGGTGQTIYTPGDILYADASNTLAKLPIGIAGTILRVDPSNRPAWSTAGAGTVISVTGTANRVSVVDPTVAPIVDIDVNYVGQASITTLGTVTTGTWNAGVIPTTYGGTGVNAFTANEILVGRGAGFPLATLSLVGTTGKILRSNGPNALPTFETPGIGDMVLAVDQQITAPKRFNDGTLILNGSGTGVTILKGSAGTNGTIQLPSGNLILASTTGTETLENKTIQAPTLTLTTNFQTLNGSTIATTGNITAGGTFIGTLNGNASTATSFTGALAGDVTGTQAATVVSAVGGQSAANVASGVVRANTATAVATNNTLVARDINGDFSADLITATQGFVGSLAGNATTVTTIPNLGGEVTNTGNNVTLSNAAVIGKTLTGYTTGTGAVLVGDNILQAIGKVEGNANLKAPINNPTFTGTVSIPSPFTLGVTSVTSTGTQLNYLNLAAGTSGTGSVVYTASPTFTGTPTLPTGTIGTTQIAGNSTTALATTAFVTTADNLKANIASPTFTGTPTAPTAALGTNTTQLATTAFVLANSGILKFQNVAEATSPNIAAGTETEVDYPALGALTTGTASVSPVGPPDTGLGIVSSRISAADVVTVRYRNFIGVPVAPTVNLNITIIQ